MLRITSCSLRTALSSTIHTIRTTIRCAPKTTGSLRSSSGPRRFFATSQIASTRLSFPAAHGQDTPPTATGNYLDNQHAVSNADTWFDVHDPATNKVVTRVPQSTQAELEAAVASAQAAFPAWSKMSVLARQQVMFKYVQLIRSNMDRIAASITLEQGKTLADARGDVLRGLQVAEMSCAAPVTLQGKVLMVAKDMETRSYREPLGVVAAICPFSTPRP